MSLRPSLTLDHESCASEYRDFVIALPGGGSARAASLVQASQRTPAEEEGRPLCKMKSRDNKRHYEIIPSHEQPSEDAKFLVDDDLVLE
jgi:hypothetical protein